MLPDLSLISNTDLQKLFSSENHRFMDGVSCDMKFDDLKQIRAGVKKIFEEMLKRKMPVQNPGS